MAALGNVMEQAAITSVLAFSYGINGQLEDAAAAADEGVRLAADLDHLPTRAAAFFYRGFVLGWWGKVDEAEPDFADALELSHSANDLFRVYVAHGWRGQALLQANELAAAETDLDRCLALAKQLGTNFHLGAFQAFRAALDLRRGVPAVETAAEAVAISDGQPWGQSIALRIHGEALIETDPHAAGVALQQALMLQRGRECWYDAAWTNLALGNLHRHLGDEPASLAALAEARRAFADMGVGSGIAALKEVGIA
jgi:tetratricopeptide (TPR) repeat protein